MGTYILKRVIGMVPVLLVVSMIVFSLILLLPGDPAYTLLGEDAKPEQIARVRAELGLDKPIYVQYTDWLLRSLRGDFGRSIRTGESVTGAIMQRLQPSVELAILSMIIGLVISVPAGIISALRRNSLPDILSTTFSMIGVALPHFWLGIMLILVLSLMLGLLPPSGYVSPTDDLGDNLKRMIMPSLTLGSGLAAVIMRQMRSSLLEVLDQEYIWTARSKGLREAVVVRTHALKNAMIPVVTIVGLQMGRLVGGAVITETVFAIPGVGRMAVDSIFAHDFVAVQGIVLLMALSVLVANLVVDVLYAYLDPRITYS